MISDERFNKKEHILKTREFQRSYKSGRLHRMGFITAYCAENGLTHSRIGFSISARGIKQAHRRNRVRRLFREAFRKRKGSLKRGFDIILSIKKEPDGAVYYQDAETIFLKLVKALGVCA